MGCGFSKRTFLRRKSSKSHSNGKNKENCYLQTEGIDNESHPKDTVESGDGMHNALTDNETASVLPASSIHSSITVTGPPKNSEFAGSNLASGDNLESSSNFSASSLVSSNGSSDTFAKSLSNENGAMSFHSPMSNSAGIYKTESQIEFFRMLDEKIARGRSLQSIECS